MAATTEATEGPVLSLMTKRLRNLRKKHKRILQLEDEISQGKILNKDQEEVLRSKPSVLTLIDEYEKLRHPLSTALEEELQQHHQPQKPAAVAEPDQNPEEPVLEDLLKLLYFGSLFDVKPQSEFTSTMLTRTHERGCCLTYDYVTDDATDLLGEKDLDMISILGSLVVSRPGNSSLSHKNALRTCLQHAKLWLANSQQPINDATDVTYAGLRERLNKILASDYYTTSPEMKAAVEVAAAAAAGNYSPPAHVPVQGSSVSSEITVQTESDYAAYEEKDEETEHSEGQETGVDQSGPVEELPKEPSETRHAVDTNSIQQDNEPEGDTEEQNHRDVDSRDQQHNPRRGYPNHRGGSRGGGRRGGYPNGRGGRGGRGTGGYQNGRSQYYEQSANYYPRNYYNPRGRGGGRGAGGNGYSNHGPARGGHAQAEEVQS